MLLTRPAVVTGAEDAEYCQLLVDVSGCPVGKETEQMMRTTHIGWGLGIALLLACAAYILAPVIVRPKVRITCARDEQGRLIFDLKPNWRVNGLYTVDFWLEGDDERLWVLEEAQTPIRHIVYGETPHGATQKHPADDAPPAQIPNGSILCVGIDYQFDSTIPPAACIGDSVAKFRVSLDDSVTRLEEDD